MILIADHNIFMMYPLPYIIIHLINTISTMFSFYMHDLSHRICLFYQQLLQAKCVKKL